MNWGEFSSTLIAGAIVAAGLLSMAHGMMESIVTGSFCPAAVFTAPPAVLLVALRAGFRRRRRR